MLLEKQWQFIKPIFSEIKGLSQDKVTTVLMCNVELSRNLLNQRYIRLYVPQAKHLLVSAFQLCLNFQN